MSCHNICELDLVLLKSLLLHLSKQGQTTSIEPQNVYHVEPDASVKCSSLYFVTDRYVDDCLLKLSLLLILETKEI